MVKTSISNKKSKKGKGKGNEPLSASKDKHREMVPRTGLGAGAELVDSASKFLASYGKIIVPLLIAVIAGFAIFYITSSRGQAADIEMRNKIDKAAVAAESLDELPGEMEGVIAEAEEEEVAVSYAYYRYGVRAYELIERPYTQKQLKEVIAILEDSAEKLGDSEEHEAWGNRIGGMLETLKADLKFLSSKKTKQFLPWDHNSKADRPEPEVVAGANPVVVFETSVGKFEVELYETDAGNAVKHFVSLCGETNGEGDTFYDRTEFSAASFSNHFSPTGPFKNATVFTAGKQGRPMGVELEKPTTADEDDDVDTVTEKAPYTIDYQGSSTQRFRAGSIGLTRDTDNPMRARTEFFLVIDPSETLNINFEPLGHITTPEGLDVARRLKDAEIYYTYVKRQREGTDYTPRVYYDGWPVATRKRDEVPDPVRFSAVETEIANGENPVVVIELEKGDVVIELFEDVCPNTVANFINLVEEGFYDQECEFYRVLGTGADLAEIYKARGERIAQGGFDGSASRDGYDYGIKNEAVDNDVYDAFFGIDRGGVANGRGTIAMARPGQGPDPMNGASTEFFINLKDHPNWDEKNNPYCVFGEVLYGIDLAAQIQQDDKILSAKVLRKRDHKYVPEVQYEEGAAYVEKEPVDIPDPLDVDADDEDE